MSQNLGASARLSAIQEINNRTPRKFDPPRDDSGRRLKISELFGMNTFGAKEMRDKLPKDIFSRLQKTIQSGQKLDGDIANTVATAVKEWAIAKGATHFCHWFQPQTGLTAEKHDAFANLEESGVVLEKFSGAMLIQSEPDASSFPSGGMRTTFEARGYTAWDPSSPMFIMESASTKTLCIPSVFISYHGDALDEKTGLLKSVESLSTKATELLALLGEKNVMRVLPTLGVEQEYFLIDRSFYSLRPDLVMSGRSLLGAQPPKGQQLEDHYFGAIPARVQAFMSEMEYDLYKLGVPVKTRHNEVAPHQYETAPVFEDANIATDHNQLTMEVIRKVALRHNFQALLHEKPFAGINGSGKHNNWSMMIRAPGSELDGHNLLEPGKTPRQNVRFLVFLTAILRGVQKHSGLMRASIASSGNDHRLGANEAPPAIISVFLGELLSKILNELESGKAQNDSTEKAVISLGVSQLPEVSKDSTDRNRTSPFAFTGNKFEFRAVGSSASPAFPVTCLNAAVADGISEVIARLKAKGVNGTDGLDKAILEVVAEFAKSTKSVRFEGNGYSEDWKTEAEKRGLPHLRKTPEALAEIVSASSVKLFSEFNIFSKDEVHSRYHVRVERYLKNMLIEADSLRQIVDTSILPAGFDYYGKVCNSMQAALAAKLPTPQASHANQLAGLLSELQKQRQALEVNLAKVESTTSESEKAKLLAYETAVIMEDIRKTSDSLEAIVADDCWPLPKYREMLFLS